jgi:hypothetical protein
MKNILFFTKTIAHAMFMLAFFSKIYMNLKVAKHQKNDTVIDEESRKSVSIMPGVELILVFLICLSNPAENYYYTWRAICSASLVMCFLSYLPLLKCSKR